MKKSLFKLIVLCIGMMYLSQPGTMDNLKGKAREIINRPMLQLEQELNRLMNFWTRLDNLLQKMVKLKQC